MYDKRQRTLFPKHHPQTSLKAETSNRTSASVLRTSSHCNMLGAQTDSNTEENDNSRGKSCYGQSCRSYLLGTSPKWTREAEAIRRGKLEGKKVHFATSMDLCLLKNSDLEQKFHKYKGRVVLRGDTVKDDSGTTLHLRSKVLQRDKWRSQKLWMLLQGRMGERPHWSSISWMHSASSTNQCQNCDGKTENVLEAAQHKYRCQNRREKTQSHHSLEPRHGKSHSKVCWTLLRVGAQDGWPTSWCVHTLFGRSPNKTRRSRNGWRVARDVHSDCIEMLVFNKSWNTRSALDI